MFYRVVATVTNAPSTPTVPEGIALVPAGSFSMGDCFTEGYADELPVHTVYVSAFYMDKTEVTKAKWDEVYAWAVTNGYSFDLAGSGKASGHPVQTVNWYDCVKWCNARSQKEGLTPCYTVGGATYKTGQSAPDCSWTANGYRLPTEAEWEKAARGGLSGKRFPWGGTITQSQANYYSYWSGGAPYFSYDLNATEGDHPAYDDGTIPYTSPVGAFAANGYGLYDMAGNVYDWCWDWYGQTYYSSSPSSDPQGPSSGAERVARGGVWYDLASSCRAASRFNAPPSISDSGVGFRSVRSAQ
jgi:formylglycine-generating enzyme required for sulfatase activity